LRYLPRDHDLGRLDHGQRLVTPAELELVDGIACDDRGQRLIADPQTYLGEQSLAAHFLDDPAQLVAAAAAVTSAAHSTPAAVQLLIPLSDGAPRPSAGCGRCPYRSTA
jgi:hypothetical protein